MTILFQNEGRRVILLSQSFEFNSMQECRANISQAGATLTVMSDQEGPENFVLTSEEADAFVEAWQAYRTEQQAAKEREQQREAQMVADAFAIVEQYSAIKIEEQPNYYGKGQYGWSVSVPSLGWGHNGYIGSPTGFLQRVKDARDMYLNHAKATAYEGA